MIKTIIIIMFLTLILAGCEKSSNQEYGYVETKSASHAINTSEPACLYGYKFIIYQAGQGGGIVQILNHRGYGIRCDSKENSQ